MIRTFFGIELDLDTRQALDDEISYLNGRVPRVHWHRPESLHITLKFIGNVPTAEIGELFWAADEAAARMEPFSLSVEGLGCFPRPDRPRIVWAGCGAGSDALIALVHHLEEACLSLGYEKERKPFTPHITIGRVKHPSDADGLQPVLADNRQTQFGIVDIGAITVFMSELKRKGAEYSAMHHARLGSD